MKQSSGRVGAIRQKALKAVDLANMERHGKREDESGKRRRVREAEPLVACGLDLRDLRRDWMDGVQQQGNTAALHAFVQYPTELIDAKSKDQQERMLRHAVRFMNDFHGGDAVFAARLDRDEKGRHGVDVFMMPRHDFRYKNGSLVKRSSVSKHTKAEAQRRYGKQDRRSQGSALQDAWFEYLRDEMRLDVLRPQRKKATAADRVEPEKYGLERDKQTFNAEARKRALALKARDEALKSGEAKLSRDLEAARASIRKDQREAALALAVAQRVAESMGDQSAANEVREHRNKLKRDERSR
jgi:hypothetical protein